MTWGNIFGVAVSTTPSTPHLRHTASNGFPKIISERDGSNYGYGYTNKSKSKYKADKKQAAMSALTLLAFLFFLNILQNCLKEQTEVPASDITMMMVMPQKQVKEVEERISNDEKLNTVEKPWPSRRARSLLEAKENSMTSKRQEKFIRDFRDAKSDWPNHLSQLTDGELQDHRVKTDNLQLFLKSSSTESNPLSEEERQKAERTNGKEIGRYRAFHALAFPWKNGRLRRKSIDEDDWVPSMGPVHRANLAESHTVESRNRRSDIVNTRAENAVQEDVLVVTPSNIDHSTHPVYNNHKHIVEETETQIPVEKKSSDATLPTGGSGVNPTVEYLPLLVKNVNHRYTPMKNRMRPSNHKHFMRHPSEMKYRYSPYRRKSSSDYSEYYPVAIVKTYPKEDDQEFDLIKFIWTFFTNLTKPLKNMVPDVAKVGSTEEPRCYDLLVCEAHRISRFMGPAAEAVTSTISALLTWYTPQESRQILIDAVTAGKENTCRQQIRNCNEKSGGKSAMTIIAQVMETKIR